MGRKARDTPRDLISERTRLAIISALAVNPSLTFTELKGLLDATDGNLSVHARKLEDAKLIQCKKSIANRMSKSVYRITRSGHAALEEYLGEMEELIRSVRGE
ncbi:MAG: transcriptional regulator [Gammaproteobacteria bacterium]|jgi:DNA-binding MarR family transcriptional regulator|nr:transcriptional regulator [Gammaproteobacteria bacterium]MDP6098331.1 transcriptional regulator [Gammaproteobacteria bacterium]MDP7456278.1 transcriptional regulator [Gammaproteobacteria bacterium]HJO12469.1 transcriptional regulator [Gammaproteobacteria bacterium]|tara:strand:+ start:4576 stop:4884 length:309 start_codon:yes stop_codon:yes gene_type:complete